MAGPRGGDAATVGVARVWSLRIVIAVVLVAGVAIAVGSVARVGHDGIRSHDAWTAGVLAVVSLAYDVVARRVERIRRMTSAGPYVNMGSVFVFACAVVLPLMWLVTVVLVSYAYVDVQSRIERVRRPWYRVGYNTATALIAFTAAHGVHAVLLDAGRGTPAVLFLALAAAVLTAAAVNTAMVGLAIALSRPEATLADLVGDRSSNLLEIATLAIGAMVAVVVPVEVFLCLLAVPAMISLQRSAMVDQLESAASNDGKTGLLNATAWQALAERELVRCAARARMATVVVVDLDHFKRVNDTYGHLTGDAVLRAVAETMAEMLRDRDLLARFGGEEFVALLADADADEALRVAERLRARVAEIVVTQVGDPPQAVRTAGDPLDGGLPYSEQIRVTVSAGLASFPQHGETVTALLSRADTALYDAKHAGRNRVRVTSSAS